jgi:hypothetical protein
LARMRLYATITDLFALLKSLLEASKTV